jgi:hypothetical protein
MTEYKSSTVSAGITCVGIWVILGFSGAPEWSYIAAFFFAAFFFAASIGWLTEQK